MKIASIYLENFRCFGPKGQAVCLRDLTALLGANGSGKSAVLMALSRLFGVTGSERTLESDDFHVPAGEDADAREEASLRIEVVLQFPELGGDDADAGGPAACFKHMTVQSEGEVPYCRLRLTGRWERSNLPDGEVEQKLEWVTSPTGTEEAKEKTSAVRGHDRSMIHVYYVPAARDPAKQIRLASGSLLQRLLRAVYWSDGAKEQIQKASVAIRDAFEGEAGVDVVHQALRDAWEKLHAAPEHRQVTIRPVSRALADIIRQVEATFSPGPSKPEDGLGRLSDGQKSLFYLSIVAALFAVQEQVSAGDTEAVSEVGIDPERLGAPCLSILAIEEPENHVAPHFLGRIMTVLRGVAEQVSGQVVITSHSASIVARVEPEEVRCLRREDGCSIAREVRLPKEGTEQYKFVREAVLAYPELYFARVVILGEGSSEEVVLPWIARAMDLPLDRSFVSVVPLGGRHVNHLWRLLTDLEIPHVTLLDLDLERPGGGWGRIQYALKQLLAVGHNKKKLLAVSDESGKPSTLSDEELENLQDRSADDMENWIAFLESYDVFFSGPLDLDFMMQKAFQKAYEQPDPGATGPIVPEEDEEARKAAVRQVIRAVLKGEANTAEHYSEEDVDAFFWYRYLFLARSKPSTHLQAVIRVSTERLKKDAPTVLKKLLNRVASLAEERDGDGGE